MERIQKFLIFVQNVIHSVATESHNNPDARGKGQVFREPKEQMAVVLLNYAGMLYLLCDATILHLTTVYVSLPFVYINMNELDDQNGLFWARALSWFIYLNFLANYVMILYGSLASVYCSPKELPLYNVQTHEDWIHCTRCDRQVPLRTRHCNICDRCILKRDHHCFFTGCCIGFYNQRYFVCLSFWGLCASLYGIYYLHWYLSTTYVTFFSVEFYKYFLPYAIFAMLFGYVDLATIALLVLFYFTVVGTISSCYFTAWQTNLIITGQTSYEMVRGQKTYQSNISCHLKSVFGKYWYLNLLFPMPFLKNDGDGLTWKTDSTKFL